MQTRTYGDLFKLIQSLAGVGSFAPSEQDDIANLINRRFLQAFNESPIWPRYIVSSEKRDILALTLSGATASTSTTPRKFTGLDSTNFDGELAVGNVFKYTKSSTDYYHRVKRFTSDSELFTFQPTRNTIVDGDNQAFSKPNFLVISSI